MVVNSPNFFLAYNSDGAFRDIVNSEFVEVVLFERNKDALKTAKNLGDLLEFYKGLGQLHQNMPHRAAKPAWRAEVCMCMCVCM